MNEEEKKSHVVPFPWWVMRASLNGQHTSQTIIPGKTNVLDPSEERKQGCVGMAQQKYIGGKQR